MLSVLRCSALVVDDEGRGAQGLRAGVTPSGWSAATGSPSTSSPSWSARYAATARSARPSWCCARARAVAPLHVTARVAPLSTRLVLALVEDRTRERRVEAIRRDFVANVSHELKTPVGAIKLLAEAVQDAADDPEAVHRFAGRMQTESDRLTRLVQQIIELSRLQGDDPLEEPQTGRRRRDRRPRDRPEPRSTPQSKDDRASCTTASAGCRSSATTSRCALALGNLVANAVAYSPDGTHGRRRAPRADEPMVDISVTDQGIGIPADEIDRIFERFYRVDPARHRSTGGTGLGLSIVKHVAASHGGEVRVWSRRGPGLDVHPVPARVGAADDRPSRRPRTPEPPDQPAASRQEADAVTRVLVVEDEESYSDALAYMLRKEGFEVAVAATGPDALAEFDRNGADIVLLDLMLPGLPGTEVCRQIRQTSNVPVIMVSAKDDEVDKVVGLELGADDYVTKPYSPRELVARIRAVLRRGAGARPAPRRPSRPARCGWTSSGTSSPSTAREVTAAAQGVRAARDVPAQPRPGAHPRPADRPGLGLRLRRRHQDPRRPREAAARQDRARPGRAELPRDGPRPRLQVRGLTGHGLCVGVDGAGVLEADGVGSGTSA